MTYPVLLLILAATTTTTTTTITADQCPDMCLCKTYPSSSSSAEENSYYTSVTCDAEYSSPKIIKQLSANTREFSISNLNTNTSSLLIEIIGNLEKLKNLTNLKFVNNNLSNLQSNLTFNEFNKIQSINLSSNKLRKIPVFNLTSLKRLDLSNNTIKLIENQQFRTMLKLELLNLSINLIKVIDSDSFRGLIALKCLDLSKNNLTTLNDKVLLPLPTLQYLNLSGNHLNTLNEQSFIMLQKLQQLDVSWNHLTHIAAGSLELPSLIRLILSGNSKLGKTRELVGTGKRLQIVDISNTGLEQVPSALTHSIRTLHLSKNQISIIRSGDFDSYPLLKLLDFVSNRLEIIEDDALGRLDSLTILYLTDNQIKDIPKSLPEKLKVLHLKRNRIARIKFGDLHGLVSLEVLLLNDNRIEILDEGVFCDLLSLSTLDLSRNPINVLNAGSLTGPLALQVLRLSNIPKVLAPAKEVSFPLVATEHLTSIDLSYSPGLAKQLLTDTAVLVSSKELQELDISYTNTALIRSDLLYFLPQLRTLRIEGNYINCTELEWLAHWMRKQDNEKYKTITCNSPPELWGSLLVDLQQEEQEVVTQNYKSTTVFVLETIISNIKPTQATNNDSKESFNTQVNTNDSSDVTFSISSTEMNFFESNETKTKSDDLALINSTNLEAMFRTSINETKYNTFLLNLHPYNILLIILGLLGISLTLLLLALRFIRRRKRRNLRQLQQNDLETIAASNSTTLPSISELW